MIRPSKAVIAGAAIAGLLTGSVAVRAYAASTLSNPGVSLQTMADAEKGKHACKGQNDCKGQGGCKTSDAGCKGQTPALVFGTEARTFTFLKGFDRYAGLNL